MDVCSKFPANPSHSCSGILLKTPGGNLTVMLQDELPISPVDAEIFHRVNGVVRGKVSPWSGEIEIKTSYVSFQEGLKLLSLSALETHLM